MKLPNSVRLRVFPLLLALASATPALATYVFNTVDYPGAMFTDVRAINNSGQVAGYASFDGVTNFSFTYSAGVFAALPSLGLEPSALGMNDLGEIVGGIVGVPERAFTYQSGSGYTLYVRGGWTNGEARAVNNAGVFTGWSWQTDGSGGVTSSEGFIFDPATASFTAIPIPGSPFVIAQGINAANQVVGSAQLPGGQQAFLREPDGTINLFRVASAPTRARGINDSGLITGFVEVGGVEQGFVGNSSGFELLAVPGASFTAAEAINNAGQVSGVWFDASNVSHGFIATPAASPTGTTSGGAYTFSVAVVPDVPIFIDPPVAVGYDYAIGKGDPWIAKVQLPIGVGDSVYGLKVGGRKFVVTGGEWFDFRAHGFPQGVTDFRVGCIELGAALDPANPQAFPTGLSFVAAGRFTGTQKPRKRDAAAHDGASCNLDD